MPDAVPHRPDCPDAVIVLPGIMGSELVDVATGDVLWGLSDPGWYVSAWTSGDSLRRLAVTDKERAGVTGRIKATRLLTAPAAVPVLHGFEPYTRLVSEVRRVAVHPDAVLAFPYDWRLSVEHNAGELGAVAVKHLERWREHPYWREHPPPTGGVYLSIVAHSMGGLVATHFIEVLGGAPLVRTLITLGTPFYGAVKAAYILGTGRGAPLPRARLRTLARTMPGMYDLLPTYRCVLEGGTARRLTPADIAGIGGDVDLATVSLTRADPSLPAGPAVRPFVGVEQPTMQSLVLSGGEVKPMFHTQENSGPVDYSGDSTVFRKAAALGGTTPSYVPQTHTALAKTDEATAFVRTVLTEGELTPPLPGATLVGIEVPDVVAVGVEFDVRVVTVSDPTSVSCWLVDAGTNEPLPPPRVQVRDGVLHAFARVHRPGIYRVEVKGGGYSAVSQLLLAVPSADLTRAG